jgi:pyruvate/2-oxoacid:ferredoxin oxidoreductase alpha subunit
MLDLTMEAFKLAFKYRNPVIVAGDGYLGQMSGKVRLPEKMVRPGLPDWAVWGDAAHRRNLICSIKLAEKDLEEHNERISEKYELMMRQEQRAATFRCDDASILVLACNTPARMAKGAVENLRRQGVDAGLYRPVTLWPFPIDQLRPHLDHATELLVVEASNGQLEDELRLALSHAEVNSVRIHHLRRMGGVLPTEGEIVEKVLAIKEESR